MKVLTQTETIFKEETVSTLQDVGFLLLRYGLVLVIVWIGAMKATEYEATNIERLIAHSPLLSWGYSIWTVRQFSVLIGAVELIIATLITLRHWSPRACAIGSAGAVLMFVTTLTFLFSTPGWEPTLGGFPALSHGVGEFLIKDVVLLGAALWSLAESLLLCIRPFSYSFDGAIDAPKEGFDVEHE
jgi:reactive chlorine resistance protein C